MIAVFYAYVVDAELVGFAAEFVVCTAAFLFVASDFADILFADGGLALAAQRLILAAARSFAQGDAGTCQTFLFCIAAAGN